MITVKNSEEKYISPRTRVLALTGRGILCQSLNGNSGNESLSGGQETIISGDNSDWSF